MYCSYDVWPFTSLVEESYIAFFRSLCLVRNGIYGDSKKKKKIINKLTTIPTMVNIVVLLIAKIVAT